MRRRSIHQLFPSALELGYIALISCLIVLLGNGKLILERAGMISSAHIIGAQVSTKVTTGLNSLDRFQSTGNVVDLLVWGVVGLAVYSALQVGVQALRTVEYQRRFNSQNFVHPQQYTSREYRQQIVVDTILGFILLAFLAVVGVLYVVVAMPASFAYMQRFILDPVPATALNLVWSFVIAIIATTVLYCFLKLVIRHHQVAAVDA